MRCFPETEVVMFFDNGCPYLHTHIHILYYNILSNIMIILDRGNICVNTICHGIIMHSFPFPDIEEIRCFDDGGPHLHTHLCIFIR